MDRTLKSLTLAVRGSVSGPLVDAWRNRPAAPTACRILGRVLTARVAIRQAERAENASFGRHATVPASDRRIFAAPAPRFRYGAPVPARPRQLGRSERRFKRRSGRPPPAGSSQGAGERITQFGYIVWLLQNRETLVGRRLCLVAISRGENNGERFTSLFSDASR